MWSTSRSGIEGACGYAVDRAGYLQLYMGLGMAGRSRSRSPTCHKKWF